MANVTYSAGIATAYGAAVRGGYTGTYDDFCRQQAQYADSAAAVEQAKEDAEAAASAADTSKTAAAGSASAAATSAGQASTSAANAANSATEANASKNAAATSATEAGNSATAAAGSAATAQGVLESIPPSYDDLADEVADLKEDLKETQTELFTSNRAFTFESGNITSYTGDAQSSTTRIRTINQIAIEENEQIIAYNGYEFTTFAWDNNNTYIGALQSDGSFAKSASNMAIKTTLNGSALPPYKYKFVLRNQANPSASISPTEGKFFVIRKVTDTTLSISGKIADAKATGELFSYESKKTLIDLLSKATFVDADAGLLLTSLENNWLFEKVNCDNYWSTSRTIDADGTISSNSYTMATIRRDAFIDSKPNTKYRYIGAIKDSNDKQLYCYIAEYDEDKTFISRTAIFGGSVPNHDVVTSNTTKYVRFVLGRPSSTGVTISASDSSYFKMLASIEREV